MVIYLEREIALPEPTNDANRINQAANGAIPEMLKEYSEKNGEEFPTVGIEVSINMANRFPIKIRIRGEL
jgi:hypothetical protein